ncbi:unnamed protein product [Oppiella nova]|uniref:Uncharacterized protein n=1 Tax=Oppiella nova TaxID=334625 RepID=A0A7R9LH64_9ACAR|nr:unnamed protein product [Oppiella nova]CAG2163638.1 unnamed protein product [Oppiella nova]
METLSNLPGLPAMTYGLLAIGIAFVVGRLGTVLQASYALSGSITGPLLSMFCLGIFFPCVNAIGAISGLVSGIGVCLVITTGTIIYPRPKGFQLPVSVTSCPPDIISQLCSGYKLGIWEQSFTSNSVPKYLSLTNCLVLRRPGCLPHRDSIQFTTSHNAIQKGDHSQMSPLVHYLCPGCIKSEDFKESNLEELRSQPIVIQVNQSKESGNIHNNPLSGQHLQYIDNTSFSDKDL